MIGSSMKQTGVVFIHMLIGTWTPFILIFASTFITGIAVNRDR